MDGLKPAASRGDPLSRVLDGSLAFSWPSRVTFCHRTGIPFEALVAMVRVCVFLRVTAAQGWLVGQRLRTAYIASLKVRFFKVVRKQIISHHAHNLS